MYAFTVKFGGGFDRAVDAATRELQKEGFGVLTSIDVRATMKKKLGVEMRPYLILGACNPPFAHRALEAEPDVGILMPCNVVVREEEDRSTSAVFTDVRALFRLVGRPEVAPLAEEVHARLSRVAKAVEAAGAASSCESA